MQTKVGELAAPVSPASSWAAAGLMLLIALSGVVIFEDGARDMFLTWGEAEYSHGILIPFLALYLLLVHLRPLEAVDARPSWLGVGALAAALLITAFGELSAIYVIVQYAIVLTVWAIALTLIGLRGVRVIWGSMIFLLFMVPLPRFIQWNLSDQLQLLSSGIGAALLRLGGIAVFLEGNVIDLGNYKLQVVEACAGLRYLFPLMSFGLLCALVLRGARWQRALLFLSSVPIAIFMNSFRIAITGALVNRFGTEAAEGFLHYFEGWVIFTICLLILFLEMWALARWSGRSIDDILVFDFPSWAEVRNSTRLVRVSAPLVSAAALMVAGAIAVVAIGDRQEDIPSRQPLTRFPLLLGEWQGVERELGQDELDVLQLTDYIMVDYRTPAAISPVQLYVAYYESQRKGASIHSPKACLPGGGWQIESFGQVTIPDIGPDDASGGAITINRSVVALGEERMVVYYWFQGRGRIVTNEYLAKWYIFWDSITKNRTDGALVRLISPVLRENDGIAAADQRLADFLRVSVPRLGYYIPGDVLVQPDAARESF
ncbi:MAG: VPLPA-CTERM-specific exosortase XrtD [Gammaproteobacteria bacterium]|jgi:exosortase D (VPLPA-CTERM-specific)|nr:VPLPA-CTERM-specific exosortase XrtD [Gammaproteobacteria bacterium]